MKIDSTRIPFLDEINRNYCEILFCFYNNQDDPSYLIQRAQLIGFNHYVMIHKICNIELMSIDTMKFFPKQNGKIIFINDRTFNKAISNLKELVYDHNENNFIELNWNIETLNKEVNILIEELKEQQSQFDNKMKIIDVSERAQKENVALKKLVQSLKRENNILKQKLKPNFLKQFFTPKIGILYQYSPIPLNIPKSYQNKVKLNKFPTISIVTPSLNQDKFIERTIKSIVQQDYPNLEYIIQDGGSKDRTYEIIKKYNSFITSHESKQDDGQSNAINKGFQRSTGEIMAYLNSDDILLPGALHYVGKFFEENPKVDVIYSHRIIINENDEEIGRWILPTHDSNMLRWADYIPQETLFWRRSIWDQIGGQLDDSFHFAMDWELLLSFIENKAKFKRVPRFLSAFRVHKQQKTQSVIDHLGSTEMEILRFRSHNRNLTASEIQRNLRTYSYRHLLYHYLYMLGVLKY